MTSLDPVAAQAQPGQDVAAETLLGGLRPGWPVLIHAVGSGVSTAAAQIARAAGASVIGTSRTPDKLDRARALGLDHGILVGKDQPRFAEEVKRLTAKKGVPLVLDFVGGPYLAENLASLAPGGRVEVIGVMGGPKAELDLGTQMRLRASVVGTVLRPRPLEEEVAATQAFARDVLLLVAAGKVKRVLDAAFPMAQVREAIEEEKRAEVALRMRRVCPTARRGPLGGS